MEQFTSFPDGDKNLKVVFQETTQVVPGVVCDVYSFPENPERDLGIIRIEPGMKTPLQKVLKGQKTIEGYVAGKGKLVITHTDGSQSVFNVDPSQQGFSYSVQIGEIMQWQADEDSSLTAFEVCFPPYEDGRFENLAEE